MSNKKENQNDLPMQEQGLVEPKAQIALWLKSKYAKVFFLNKYQSIFFFMKLKKNS